MRYQSEAEGEFSEYCKHQSPGIGIEESLKVNAMVCRDIGERPKGLSNPVLETAPLLSQNTMAKTMYKAFNLVFTVPED